MHNGVNPYKHQTEFQAVKTMTKQLAAESHLDLRVPNKRNQQNLAILTSPLVT